MLPKATMVIVDACLFLGVALAVFAALAQSHIRNRRCVRFPERHAEATAFINGVYAFYGRTGRWPERRRGRTASLRCHQSGNTPSEPMSPTRDRGPCCFSTAPIICRSADYFRVPGARQGQCEVALGPRRGEHDGRRECRVSPLARPGGKPPSDEDQDLRPRRVCR